MSDSVAAVRVSGVSKSFGAVEVLADVDLCVAPGEFFTLVGPSGSGKTTLLRIIAGLEPPTSGLVTINGGSPAAARRQKLFGWVPQSPALLPWRSVSSNVRLLSEVNRSATARKGIDASELVRRVGLDGFQDALPHELSGGMQQRVALVRAFAIGAPILLMDEPFAALDEITRTEMRHVLIDLWVSSAAAVVFVTHSISEAAYLSDRVAVLSARPGRVFAMHEISLPRPRSPQIEDSDDFFATVKTLRNSLGLAMGETST